MPKANWTNVVFKILTNPKDGGTTFQYIAILAILAQYIFKLSIMLYESLIAVVNSTDIENQLNKLRLSGSRHRECTESYSYIIALIIFALIIEMYAAYFLNQLIKSSIRNQAIPMIGIIFFIEKLVESVHSFITIVPEISLSDPTQKFITLLSDGIWEIFCFIYTPIIILGNTPLNDLFFMFEVLLCVARSPLGTSTSSIEKTAIFSNWEAFSSHFVENMLKIFQTAVFNKENCKVVFSDSEYITVTDQNIEIPSMALATYGESALLGYVGFGLGEMKINAMKKLTFLFGSSKLLKAFIFFLLIRKSNSLSNPLLESIWAVRIVRFIEFISGMAISAYSRRIERACDDFAVQLNLKDNLIEYIQKLDMGRLKFSSFFTWATYLSSPRNSLKDRIERILKMKPLAA